MKKLDFEDYYGGLVKRFIAYYTAQKARGSSFTPDEHLRRWAKFARLDPALFPQLRRRAFPLLLAQAQKNPTVPDVKFLTYDFHDGMVYFSHGGKIKRIPLSVLPEEDQQEVLTKFSRIAQAAEAKKRRYAKNPTMAEVHRSLAEMQQEGRKSALNEAIARVLAAPASGTSKRKMLGLDKPKRGKASAGSMFEGESGLFGENPKSTLIYSDILEIKASKAGMPHVCDAACKRAGHRYIHKFKKGSPIRGTAGGKLSVG